MPFSGGVAGTHTDSMHEGNAKRDTAGGLAGLEGDGDVLAPGANVVLTRNGADQMELHERTSGEIFARWVREGLDDYTQWLRVGTVAVEVLHTAMKNVANGVAGLDANLLPSIDCLQTNLRYDIRASLNVSGNGVSSRDANIRRYSLDTGSGSSSSANVKGLLSRVLGSTPLIYVARITNIANGSGTLRESFIGFMNAFDDPSAYKSAIFMQGNDNNWQTYTKEATTEEAHAVTVSDGDVLGIVATSTDVKFYINYVLVQTHTTKLPTSAIYGGAGVFCTSGASVARHCDIDVIECGLEI